MNDMGIFFVSERFIKECEQHKQIRTMLRFIFVNLANIDGYSQQKFIELKQRLVHIIF